jgi:hypothetical protein
MIARVLFAAVVTAGANLHQTKSTFASDLEFSGSTFDWGAWDVASRSATGVRLAQ